MSNRRNIIERHLRTLVGERHPDSAPRALNAAARYLATQLSRCGWETSRQSFSAWGKTYRNIIAVRNPPRREAKNASPPILVGAHYDTVVGSPGADDNASALVVLLETAWHLRQTVFLRPVWLVAFCLEEQGLLGSQAFASRLKATGRELAGAIILECVGYASRKPGSQQLPPGVPIRVPAIGDFLGIIGNEASQSLVAAVERGARRARSGCPTLSLSVPACGEALPDVRRSDHAAFWDEGFPAVMLTDTANYRNPHYHQMTDTIETLDLNFIKGVIDIVVASVKELAGRTKT